MKQLIIIFLGLLVTAFQDCGGVYTEATDKALADSAKVYHSKYIECKNTIEQLQTDTANYRRHIAKLQKDSLQNQEAIDKLNTELGNAINRINEERNKAKSLISGIETILSDIDDYEIDNTDGNKIQKEQTIVSILDKVYKLSGQKTPVAVQDRIRSLFEGSYYTDSEIESIKQRIIDSMTIVIKDTTQVIINTYEKKLSKLKDSLETIIKQKDGRLRLTEQNINTLQDSINKINNRVIVLQKKNNVSEEKINQLELEKINLQRQIDKAKDSAENLYTQNMIRNIKIYTNKDSKLKKIDSLRLTFCLSQDVRFEHGKTVTLYFRVTENFGNKNLLYPKNFDSFFYKGDEVACTLKQTFELKNDIPLFLTKSVSIPNDISLEEDSYQIDVFTDINGTVKSVGSSFDDLQKRYNAIPKKLLKKK